MTEIAPDSDSDSLLIEAARTIALAAPKIARIWPGYWPTSQAFIITIPNEEILLYTTRRPPSRFRQIRVPAMPEAGDFYLLQGALDDLSASRGFFDLAYNLGADTAPAVPLQQDLASTLRLLYHEAFHAHQKSSFGKMRRPDLAIDGAGAESARFRALAEIERRLLAHIIGAGAHADRMIEMYLAVREHRMAGASSDIDELERYLERLEGTAQYVAHSAVGLALGISGDVERAILSDLEQPLRFLRFGPEWNIRLRVYGTGAALGHILTERGVRWKKRLSRGEGFDEILESSIRADPKRADTLVQQAFEAFDFASILATLDSGPKKSP